MLLSYCYIFSPSPSSAPADEPLSSRSRDTPASSTRGVQPQPASTLLTSFSDWSNEIATSLRSALPSPVTSLLSTASEQAAQVVESSSEIAQSKFGSISSASWFAPSSSEVSRSPSTSLERTEHVANPAIAATSTRGNTTFTFCLFGAASSAAVYLLARNRRTMKHLQSAKSLAYRDARAWRRVALDFARINALSASRVQNLVAASLRDVQAGGDIGRQIERELEEATRTVAQRRNWIQQQDHKDAEAAASSSSQRSFGDAWSDIFDPHHTGFFFGSRGGRRGSDLGDYSGRWRARHAWRLDEASCASSDGLSFKAPEHKAHVNSSHSCVEPSSTNRSAQLKWQRAAGHSATVGPVTSTLSSTSETQAPQATTKESSPLEDTETQAEAREEWIGDVDRAIRERDLKSSQPVSKSDQAAVEAFSHFESEPSIDTESGSAMRDAEGQQKAVEDEDFLLPVSDLHIATNGRLRDMTSEVPIQRAKAVASSRTSRTKMGAAKVNTTVTNTDKYVYPISDQFGDLHDIFIAAWDGNLTGLSQSAVVESKPDNAAESVKPKPNRALFEQLRSQSKQLRSQGMRKGVQETNGDSTSSAEVEFMAELMFPSPAQATLLAPKPSPVQSEGKAASSVKEEELIKQLEQRQAELMGSKYKIDELSERLDTMREMCHDLTDEASRREKIHKIQVEQLDQKIGLFTVWAEEVQRRLGLETPPFFASLRKPLKRE